MSGITSPDSKFSRFANCAAFEDEFLRFLRARSLLRRYMPTPDRFPLVCELVDAAKAYYVRLPRVQRHTMKYIPFFYFGMEWAIRINFSLVPCAREVYIDLCRETRAVMVTVAVAFDNDLLEAIDA